MKRLNAWSAADDQFIRDNYGTSSYREMAIVLERTEKAVKSRAAVLGIRKNRRWSDDDLQTLSDLLPDTPITTEMAEMPLFEISAD